MINYDIKFLTSDEGLHLKNGDFKTYKYETKKKHDESVYDSGKKSYCERRGGSWRALQPRQIRQLELKLHSVVYSEWISDSLIILVLSSGCIVYLTIKLSSLDILQILFDRYCVGRLAAQTVTGVILSKTHLLFTFAEKLATLVYFGKNSNNQLCRIADRDPQIQNVELGGGARRAERRLSYCETSNGIYVLIWSVATTELVPWSPIPQDLANLHVYHISGQHMQLVAYHQLENETLLAEIHNNIVHIVEQITSHKGITLSWQSYDVPQSETAKQLVLRGGGTFTRLACARRAARLADGTRLATAGIDGTLHLLHANTRATGSQAIIATDIRWAGDLLLTSDESGRLQCYDRALNLLHTHTKCFELASHLKDAGRMRVLATRDVRGGALLLLCFVGGPLTLLRVSHPKLLTAWIRSGRISNAVGLLQEMDWDKEGYECLEAVNKIVCECLRTRLTSGRETDAQAALGAYLAPKVPHSHQAYKYAPYIHRLARKFFHHLIRRGRIEKALSLGVDLCAWDLFVDGKWAAERLGLLQLADEAATLAEHHAAKERPESECSESCSCSSHSCTSSEDGTSASSEPPRAKPPPLPRVPIPPQPTLIPVPITQPENISTNSIRPNLHQYLERDNTIWNIEIKDDTYIKPTDTRLKPILTSQSSKWHSMDNVLSFQGTSKYEQTDLIPRCYDERVSNNYRHMFKEDVPNTMFRHQSYLQGSAVLSDKYYKIENVEKRQEKNKVKFSDTVTVAVVPQETRNIPEPSRELADSLPLCAPHNFLAAFNPSPVAGTPHDYVEV